jgi:hypothetical protein
MSQMMAKLFLKETDSPALSSFPRNSKRQSDALNIQANEQLTTLNDLTRCLWKMI